MVDVADWVDCIKRHPLKFKFEGFRGFYRTAGEAAANDERYMAQQFSDENEDWHEAFEAAKTAREDSDEILSRFAEFCEHRISARDWAEEELPHHENWSAAPIADVLRVVDSYGGKFERVAAYVDDWCMGPAEYTYDCVRDDEGLVNEHPPIEVEDHAGGGGVPLDEVFFICPACHSQPIEFAEHRVRDGYYCGLCSASSNLDKHQDLRDFFLALHVEPWPFNKEKKAEWAEILAKRKAQGDNLRGICAGDKITVRDECDEPAEVTAVFNNSTTSPNGVHQPSGCVYVVEEGVYRHARFHEIEDVVKA